MSKKQRVVVIGSGFGGLAAAVRLQAAGFAVTIVERRDRPGGRAVVYQDDGFTFDAGPTVITAPHCLEDVFTAARRKLSDYVELLPVSPMYRLQWTDGVQFDYTQDLERTLSQIREISPRDEAGYRKFLTYTDAVFEEGYTKLAHVPFLDFAKMLRVAPQLMRLQAFRSVYSIVSKYIRDPHLREAFSFHSLLVGGNPFQTSSIYTLIHSLERKWGVYFPKGGTGALVGAFVKLFEELGGEIRYNAPVDRILTRQDSVSGVALAGGGELEAEVVVSNADVNRTYQHLLRQIPAVESTRRWLNRARYSMSLFLIYFGTKRKYPDVAHHTVLFGPRYRGLLDDIFKRSTVAEDFSLYLHAPTVTDPSLAPEGSEAFYVLSPVPHLQSKTRFAGSRAKSWPDFQREYADRILGFLERSGLPGLRAEIVTERLFHPEDFSRELEATHGSAFSIEPLLRQSAYFRIHNRDPKVQGLYFVGAGTHPGAGVPGVVNSARATSELVVRDRLGEEAAYGMVAGRFVEHPV